MRKHIIIFYIVLLFTVNWFFSNFITFKDYNEKRLTLHTITEINVKSINKKKSEKAVNLAFQRIKEIEKKLNYFDPASETSQLNRLAYYQDVKVSKEMIEILQASIEGSKITQGAFDITATPITRLYGFGTEKKQIPSNKKINQSLQNIGYQYIKITTANNTVRFTKRGLMIDLGGVLKGYAVDQAIKTLKENGIKNGLVNAGGNIYAFGTKRGKPWHIAIKDPSNTKNITNEILELSDQACATSGDYEQYFYQNDKKIAHIFNPKTGKPANIETGIKSVTVIADTATNADILSTACFVLGKEKANKLIENKKIFY